MKCPKCGKNVPDTVKFCPECGYDIGEDNSTRLVQLRCKSCNGVMKIDTDKGIAVCPFCGATEMIVESDEVIIEKDRNRTYKEIELEKLKAQKEKQDEKDAEEEAKAYKKKLSSKLLLGWMVFVGILALGLCMTDEKLAGIVAFVQVGFWIASRLIGLGYFKPKYKKLRSILVTIGFLLTIPVFIVMGTSDSSSTSTPKDVNVEETYNWPQSGLAAMIPKPEIVNGHITRDSDESFEMDLYQVEPDDYRAYVDVIKSSGFDVESYQNDSSYKAFNEDGYCVQLFFYSFNNSADLTVRAPVTIEELDWELTEASKWLPDPGKRVGSIDYESSDYVSLYVGDTSRKEFKSYVKKCKEAGYTEDLYMADDSFSAKNSDGISLRISYEGFNVMKVYFTK